MKGPLQLPVPVLEQPHWRVNIRPQIYDPAAIPSLAECIRLIEKNAVRFRGWDYPHLARRGDERAYGENWVASWASFMGHLEYWRLYQSSQFVHLFSVREATHPNWRGQLQSYAASHLSHYSNVDWDSVPGFLSVLNMVSCVTEIVELTTRMAQSGVYRGVVDLTISIEQVTGFVLTTDFNRSWSNYYAASTDSLGHTWALSTESLLGASTECALEILTWIFERFGWLEPSLEVLRKDIEDFKTGRL
jgi:hypothetical protein